MVLISIGAKKFFRDNCFLVNEKIMSQVKEMDIQFFLSFCINERMDSFMKKTSKRLSVSGVYNKLFEGDRMIGSFIDKGLLYISGMKIQKLKIAY